MARELSVHVWCDLCLDEGHREEATFRAVPVAVGTVGPLLLDLCERHHKEALGPVLAALAKHGTDPAKQAARPRGRDSNKHRTGPFLCKVDGCVAAPLKHTGTLWQHLRGKHGLSLSDYEAKHGKPVPLTAKQLADLVVEVPCPVDGCDTMYSTALGHRFPQQALVSHLWGHHGIKQGRQ